MVKRPTLYPDQQELEDKIPALWKKGVKRIMVQAPTGAGKTILFSDMAYKSAAKGNKVLIVTHREELLTQTDNSLTKFGLKPNLIRSNTKTPSDGLLYVSMVETLINRLKKPEWQEWYRGISLVVADEAHEQLFNKLLSNPLTRNKYVLGFSATPKRTGHQRQLSEDYEEIIFGKDVQELINIGRLVTDRYFSVPVDMTGVHIEKGEYVTEEMFNKYDRPELYSGVVENWKRLCPDTVTLVFCVNIQHVIKTCKAFNDAGIAAKFVVSNVTKPVLPPHPSKSDEIKFRIKSAEYQNYIDNFELYSGDRKKVVGEFLSGKFKVLVNASIATTGFDFPGIQTVIMDRATTSENLLMQCIGRGSRTSGDKDFFNILDFGENCKRLGYYRQERQYSLNHDESSRRGNGIAGVKNCPKCNALLMPSATFCKYCGYIFPKTQEQKVVELAEVRYSEAKEHLSSIKDYEIFCTAKGYNKNWLFRQIFMKWGKEGLVEYQRRHNLQPSWTYVIMARFRAQGLK